MLRLIAAMALRSTAHMGEASNPTTFSTSMNLGGNCGYTWKSAYSPYTCICLKMWKRSSTMAKVLLQVAAPLPVLRP